MVATASRAAGYDGGVRAITGDGPAFHNLGACASWELAGSVAAGVAYLRLLGEAARGAGLSQIYLAGPQKAVADVDEDGRPDDYLTAKIDAVEALSTLLARLGPDRSPSAPASSAASHRYSVARRAGDAPTEARPWPTATHWTAFPVNRRTCAGRIPPCMSTSSGPFACTPGSPPRRIERLLPPQLGRRPEGPVGGAFDLATHRGYDSDHPLGWPATSAWSGWRSTRSWTCVSSSDGHRPVPSVGVEDQ